MFVPFLSLVYSHITKKRNGNACCSAKKLKLFERKILYVVFLPSIYALLRLRRGRFAGAIRERSGTLQTSCDKPSLNPGIRTALIIGFTSELARNRTTTAILIWKWCILKQAEERWIHVTNMIVPGRRQSNDASETISAVPVSLLSLLDLEWIWGWRLHRTLITMRM